MQPTTAQQLKRAAINIFFFLGERIALIALVILGSIAVLLQSSKPAFSESPPLNYSITVNGLSSLNNVPHGAIEMVMEAPKVAYTPTPTPSPTPTPIPPTPTATPTPTPAPTVDPSNNEIWDRIAHCESNQNWGDNTGNGYFGGLQFSQGAWNSVGGSGNPSEASRDEQILRGKKLQEVRGWGAWGACAHELGLH